MFEIQLILKKNHNYLSLFYKYVIKDSTYNILNVQVLHINITNDWWM